MQRPYRPLPSGFGGFSRQGRRVYVDEVSSLFVFCRVYSLERGRDAASTLGGITLGLGLAVLRGLVAF